MERCKININARYGVFLCIDYAICSVYNIFCKYKNEGL